MVYPPLTMSDVQKVLLSVNPLKPDGTPDPVEVAWKSSDPAQVGLEPVVGDSHQCYATTPLDAGKANVTASAPGYDDEVQPIVYASGQKRKLNLSAGSPEPD